MKTIKLFSLQLICLLLFTAVSINLNAQDMGATEIVYPTSPMCASAKTVTVKIKNLGATTVDFSVNNCTVNVVYNTPYGDQSGSSQLTTGTLAPGATKNVDVYGIFMTEFNFPYNVVASTALTGDIDSANDALTPVLLMTNGIPGPEPIYLDPPECTESLPIVLDAQNMGSSYLWSDNSTAQTLNVSTNGTYSVTVTDGNGCIVVSNVDIVIKMGPSSNLSFIGAPCQGSLVLDAGSPGATYFWMYEYSSLDIYTQTIIPQNNGNYQCQIIADNGCINVAQANVNFAPGPVVDLGPDVTPCGPITLYAPVGNYTYSWSDNSTSSFITAYVSGTYSVTVTDNNPPFCSMIDAINVTIISAPVVNLGPNVTQCDSKILNAGNPGCTYFWSDFSTEQTLNVTSSGAYYVTVSNSCGSNDGAVVVTITQATSSSQTLSGCPGYSVTVGTNTYSATGVYNDVLVNAIGCDSTVTTTLTIETPPAITLQPSSTAVCPGNNASFSVTATGSGLTYQWQEDAGSGFANIADGGVYSNATTNTLNLTAVPGTMNSYQYRCLISGTCSPSVTSDVVTLSANSAVTFIVQPSDLAICNGGNATFSVTATGVGLTYQWQYRWGAGTFYNLTNEWGYNGVTTSTMSITGADAYYFNGIHYRCVVSTSCAVSDNSSEVIFTVVSQPPAVTSQPANVVTCEGSNVFFSITATGYSLSYQWQEDAGSGFADITEGGNYSGVTSATMNITGVTNSMNNYTYKCLVNEMCSLSSNSNSATLTVPDQPLSFTYQTSDKEACDGSMVMFYVNVNGSGSATYQWQVNDGSGFTNINGATYYNCQILASSAENNYKYRCIVNDPNRCPSSATSNEMTLTINTDPAPVITSHPSNASVCGGGNVTFTIAATGAITNYAWMDEYNNYCNGGLYSGANTSTLTITSATLDINSLQYRCIVGGACLNVESNLAALTVNSAILNSTPTANRYVCEGDTTTLSVYGSATGTIGWYDSATGGNWLGGGTYYTTPALNSDTVFYAQDSTATCGASDRIAISVTIQNLTITTQPVGGEKFIGENHAIYVQATGFGNTYQWLRNGTTVGWGYWLSLPNLQTTNSGDYTCIITSPCGGSITSTVAHLEVYNRPYYVKAGGNDNATGDSWATAFATLGKAIVVATVDGDQIWVAKGTHNPTLDVDLNTTTDDRLKTFRLRRNMQIYGGFAGTETYREERTNYGQGQANETILSGDIGGDNTNNAYHVVTIKAESVSIPNTERLDGFTITKGKAFTDPNHKYGGGIIIGAIGSGISCSPTIANCVITGNIAQTGGGGIYSAAFTSGKCDPTFINCNINNNSSGGGSGKGGAYYAYTDGSGCVTNLTLINCNIKNNYGDMTAGAISGTASGTGTHNYVNCVIAGNSGNWDASAIANTNPNFTTTLTNCLITGNSVNSFGGDGAVIHVTNLTLINSIVWANTGYNAIIVTNPNYSYSLVQGVTDTTNNNIDGIVNAGNGNYPKFVNPFAGLFRLQEGSPCLNIGNNTANTQPYDIAGHARIQESTIDIGPYEGAVPACGDTTFQSFSECPGFSVTVGTNTYNTTGVYTNLLQGYFGCDSIVRTNLTINQVYSITQTLVECDPFSVTVGTNTYNTTGTYTDNLTTVNGCDSIITTELTVNQPTSSTQTVTTCGSYTIGDSTYTVSGTYTDVIVNSVGCDSTVTTVLTIQANPIPVIYGNLTACAIDGNFPNVPLSTDSYVTYNWSTESSSQSISANPLFDNPVTVTVTDSNGCTGVSLPVNMTIKNGVPLTITVSDISDDPLNIATGGTASASDSYSGNGPETAFDGDKVTYGWGNEGNGLPSWLEYDLGAGNPKAINAYSIFNSTYQINDFGSQYSPVAWTFEGWNGTAWDTLDIQTNANIIMDTRNLFPISDTNSYQKYRIVVASTPDGWYASITELELNLNSVTDCNNKKFSATSLQNLPWDWYNSGAEFAYQWYVNGVASGTDTTIFESASLNSDDAVSCVLSTDYVCASNNPATSNTVLVVNAPVSYTQTFAENAGFSITVGSNTYNTTGVYTDTFVAANGCDSIVTTDLTINSYEISGIVTYDNTVSTPMNNSTVYLYQNSVKIDSVVTDVDGAYLFTSLGTDNYSVSAITDKAYSGVNATDALLVQQHYVEMNILTEPRLAAADVNASSSVNTTDALFIQNRFNGTITSFPSGDWYFNPQPVTISSSNEVMNFKALCFGDVNGSNVPSAAKSGQVTVEFVNNETVVINNNTITDIPVKVQNISEIGAVSLVINYPQDLLEISSVNPVMTGMEDLLYNISNGQVRLTWYNLQSLNANANDVLFTLSVKSISNEITEVNFGTNHESEVADASALPYSLVQFELPTLTTSITSVNSNIIADFNVNFYPNPVKESAIISYSLQLNGKVNINLYDVDGRLVKKIADLNQNSGYHSITLNTNELAQGIYQCAVSFEVNSEISTERIIISVIK